MHVYKIFFLPGQRTMKLPVDFAIFVTVFIQLTDSLDKGKVHRGKWLNVESAENKDEFYMFDWLVKVSAQKCVDACKSTKACQYMNYDVRANKCVLIRRNDDLDSNDEPVVETKPGHMFGNKSEWVNNELSQCDECAIYGECHIDGSLDSEYSMCKTSGCRKPADGVDFLGNSFTTGSSIRLKYDYGQVFPASMTCTENGTWGIDQSVCAKNPNTNCFKGSYYFIESKNMTWLDAKMHCKNLLGHLVDVNAEGEQMFLTMFLSQASVAGAIDSIWTGGNDLETEGDFRWSDGSEFSADTHWFLRNPDNWRGAENCVEMLKRFEYFWNDENCSTVLPSVCEFPINNS